MDSRIPDPISSASEGQSPPVPDDSLRNRLGQDDLARLGALLDLPADQVTFSALFTRYAESYDAVVGTNSQYRRLQQEVADILQGCSAVADIGCGTGNQTILLAKKGIHVDGYDSNEEMLKKAELKVQQEGLEHLVDLHLADASCFTLPPNRYDGAAMLNVLYALDDPYHALDQAYRALKKDGILVVSGPKPDQDVRILTSGLLAELLQTGRLQDRQQDLQIVSMVNQLLDANIKNHFSTERMKRILLEYVGFSDVLAADTLPGKEVYMKQAFLLAVKKGIVYAGLPMDDLVIRQALPEELPSLYRFRYHYLNERKGHTPPFYRHPLTDADAFDEHAYHLIASHHGKLLGTMRLVEDSPRDKLPADAFYPLDHYRQQGARIIEPGRWIRMPYVRAGVGLKLLFEAFRFSRAKGATHWVQILEADEYDLYKKIGVPMDTPLTVSVNGIERQAYLEIVDLENPPRFLRRAL
ncbi:MAG: methyltransferase domain-containing protein [DPANN group archaeon]|nr:methyltransferase domain-containing protein [DPANN group archaeon]